MATKEISGERQQIFQASYLVNILFYQDFQYSKYLRSPANLNPRHTVEAKLLRERSTPPCHSDMVSQISLD